MPHATYLSIGRGDGGRDGDHGEDDRGGMDRAIHGHTGGGDGRDNLGDVLGWLHKEHNAWSERKALRRAAE